MPDKHDGCEEPLSPDRRAEREAEQAGRLWKKNRQTWAAKFGVAISGLTWSVKNHNSFRVHIVATFLAIAVAAGLRVEWWQWAAIVVVTGGVWTAELLNTAIETLVLVMHPQHDERIGRALDAAAAGVLVASVTAIAVGLIVLGPDLYERVWAFVK
ncbi:diacylglycerol kinase (ATP) [Neorhodopirellula lusitana]|uniref:Diacylglycerol kinase (ATP) n=1 Tax=Neorhodopirellula lusitana TaxID=445327 RepID=A0ABY1PWW7_9BACT|nr:diacylglycerol kinase [Neorhodopirellula lusitana]SMP51587.1 diacylglycerol kinase (ATP) [Neorhodopirellula lusitana]